MSLRGFGIDLHLVTWITDIDKPQVSIEAAYISVLYKRHNFTFAKPTHIALLLKMAGT